jgi:hypothetical protein
MQVFPLIFVIRHLIWLCKYKMCNNKKYKKDLVIILFESTVRVYSPLRSIQNIALSLFLI